jgi:nucleoside-diphosphate-sugar epimerase
MTKYVTSYIRLVCRALIKLSGENNMKQWTVGITGGAGYIGSSLAKHLAQSFNVKIIDIKEPKRSLSANMSFQHCDVRNYEAVKAALQNVDLVVHMSIIQIPVISEQKRLGYEVNLIGTQNVCKAVDESPEAKGLILSSSWHTIGERGLKGVIDEEFGFRPDKVEDRARLYALAKIAQESIVRFYDEMSPKIFGIIRMGTVLGEGMPEKTAANIFIENGLKGKPLTPFKHSMYRPMLYVDINDICQAYERLARRILENGIKKEGNSLAHIFNVYYPNPITIIELAEMSRDAIAECSKGKIKPEINVVDTGQPSVFNEKDKNLLKVDTSKALKFLGIEQLKSPKESMQTIIRKRIAAQPNFHIQKR